MFAIGLTVLITFLSDPIAWAILIALLWSLTLTAVLFLLTRIRHLNDDNESLRYAFHKPIEVGSHQV